jgi:hypothetical protein
MGRRISLLCLAGLLAAGVALGEDFWEKREYMQWTDSEVKKLLTDSPWAKDVSVTAPMAALGRGQRAVETNTDAESTGGGGRRGRGGGGGGGAAPSEAIVTINVSFRSALPMRKALVRSRLGAGATVPPDALELLNKDQGEYVIVVSGVPAAMARAIQDPALLEKSTIRAGKKSPVVAAALNVQPRTQTVDVVYIFPKSPAITADDKDVEVMLKVGPIEAKRKFNLKDMVYNGKLEL